MTQEPISEKEHSFAVDGTCLPTSIKQNWENDKQKLAKEKAQKEKEEAIKKEKLKERAEPSPTKDSEKNTSIEKIETEKKKTYEKMIVVCGTTYKLIASVTFPENPHANESPFFVPLLKFTNENYDRID